MECLDEETILSFCHGGLAAEKRRRAEDHIAECDECRALVSVVMRSSSPSFDPAMAPTTPVAGASPSQRSRAAEVSASAPVAPGDVLAGKFEVERVLGAGGMGVVVAARHTQLDQRVALKFLLPVACEVPGAVNRFLREGKAAARITSEHVARVMDTGMLDAGAPYLVMEYLEGQDLGAFAQMRGRVPADEAVEYVLQACEAIVEAHELGIVHRDLKPANLFLTKRADGSPLVKVLDFGISKIEGGSHSQLTSASVLMGSPRYMSPEQMLSARDVDARADVWALGVILFELVSGKPVWEADTVQGLCALIASAPAPRLRSLVPDAPAVLDDVVARCLAKSRDERIASVADLAIALEPIAPASARTSVERIVRVAGRAGAPRSGPSARAGAGAGAGADTRKPVPLGAILGLVVAALLAAGIALNATLLQRGRASAATDPAATASGANGATAAAPAISTSTPSTSSPTASAATQPAASTTGTPRRPGTRTASPSPPPQPSAATPTLTAAKTADPPKPAPSDSNRALTDRK